MKKYIWILVILLLVAGFFLVPRVLHSDSAEISKPAVPEGISAQSEDEESEEEPVYYSDPVYGEHLTREELEQLKEQDGEDNGSSGLEVYEEYVIELDENQATGGF